MSRGAWTREEVRPRPTPARDGQLALGLDVAACPEPEPEPVTRCNARGCERPTDPRYLMCRRHWEMVPEALRKLVWRHFRPGQERTRNPSPEYVIAARAAIEAVAALELDQPRTESRR